jgi:hypothetical protein
VLYRTRMMAWTYIIVEVPVLLRALYIGLLASKMIGGHVKVDQPLPSFVVYFMGVGMLRISLVLLAVVLFHLIPWIYLLKQRAWAWWMITFEYAAVSVMAAIQLLGQHALSMPALSSQSAKTAVFAIPVSTVIVLLLDRPSIWTKPHMGAGPRASIDE